MENLKVKWSEEFPRFLGTWWGKAAWWKITLVKDKTKKYNIAYCDVYIYSTYPNTEYAEKEISPKK